MASSGMRDAPVSARRTEAKLSAGASSKWLKANHSGGAPKITVTLRSRMVSSAVDGSKRWTSTTVAPRSSVMPSTTFSPKMWNSGRTP